MKNNKGNAILGIIIGAIIIGLIIGIFKWNWEIKYGNIQTIEIKVKDKYIKRGRNSESKDKYLIVDTDKNTYQITDLTLIGKWNSTDLYNELEIGKKYEITTSGVRNQFWSMYQNINKIREID